LSPAIVPKHLSPPSYLITLILRGVAVSSIMTQRDLLVFYLDIIKYCCYNVVTM